MSKNALITGASSGIGAELAKIHANTGGGLILVARSTEKLNNLKSELKDKASFIHCISQDLCEQNAGQIVFDKIKELDVQVDYLINNAGFGGQGAFHKRQLADEKNMMQLNMVVLTELCHLFLPQMIERKSGKILNVASSAGLAPGGPMQSTYFATKAYVLSLSNGISSELKGTGVSMTALCPGPTETGFEKSAGLEGTDLFSGKIFDAKIVAQDGYQAMLQGKRMKKTALSFVNKVNFALIPFLPKGLVLGMIKKMQMK